MSVQSQVQAAEEALRQALINALAEGDEEFLSELFTEYQNVSDLNRKVSEKTVLTLTLASLCRPIILTMTVLAVI